MKRYKKGAKVQSTKTFWKGEVVEVAGSMVKVLWSASLWGWCYKNELRLI